MIPFRFSNANIVLLKELEDNKGVIWSRKMKDRQYNS